MRAWHFMILVQGAVSVAPSNLEVVPDFLSGAALAQLQIRVSEQYDHSEDALRCRHDSCILPRAEVNMQVGTAMRNALRSVNRGSPISPAELDVASAEGQVAYLPALRTNPVAQPSPSFHDDDDEEPGHDATWTALLYLSASEGDRFLVKNKVTGNIDKEIDLRPGTLVMFDGSKVQHAVTSKQSLSRWAMGPVALDGTDDETSLRSRILQWGGGGGTTTKGRSGLAGHRASVSGAYRCVELWVGTFTLVLAMLVYRRGC